ncbi:hypothetical protein RFI_24348, partial [Reticulomyxa filosa]
LGDTEAIGKDVAQPKSYSGDLRQVKFVKTKYYGICKVILIGFGSLIDGEIIELKLRHLLPNRDDGTVDCKEYFKCQYSDSHFCSRKDIGRVVDESKARSADENQTDNTAASLQQLSVIASSLSLAGGCGLVY